MFLSWPERIQRQGLRIWLRGIWNSPKILTSLILGRYLKEFLRLKNTKLRRRQLA